MTPAAVVFDLFGTLLDIAALESAAARITSEPAALVATWREKQLAYAFAATIMERYEDFDALTLRALRYAARLHGVHDDEAAYERLAAEWRRVAPFSDAAETLAELRAAGLTTAVLTNGTPATARAALESAGLHDAVDATLSVDAVRVYKPDRRVYALATQHFTAAPGELVFVTSNAWDATGAAEFGLRVVWCNRRGAPPETFGAPPEYTIATLRELTAIVTAPR